MLTIFGLLIFTGAFAASVAVFAFTLAPALPRIAALLTGDDAAPLMTARLVVRDRRLPARRPMAMAAPAGLRAAA